MKFHRKKNDKKITKFFIFNFSKSNFFLKKLAYFFFLIKKLPVFVLPQPDNLPKKFSLNPFLLNLYKHESIDNCVIPSNLTIKHIFINPDFINFFSNHNPQTLLKRILKSKNLNTVPFKQKSPNISLLYTNLILKNNYNRERVLTMYTLFKDAIFNHNFIFFIDNRFRYSNNSKLRSLHFHNSDCFLDNTSLSVFKDCSLHKLVNYITSYDLIDFSNHKYLIKYKQSKLNRVSRFYKNFLDNILKPGNFFYETFFFRSNTNKSGNSHRRIQNKKLFFFFKSMRNLSYLKKTNSIDLIENFFYNTPEKKLKKNSISGHSILNFFKKLSILYKKLKNSKNTSYSADSHNTQFGYNINNFKNSSYSINKFNSINPFVLNYSNYKFNIPFFKNLVFFEKLASSKIFFRQLTSFFDYIGLLFSEDNSTFKNLNSEIMSSIFDIFILYLFLKLKRLYFLKKISLKKIINFFNGNFLIKSENNCKNLSGIYSYLKLSNLGFMFTSRFSYLFFNNINTFFKIDNTNSSIFNKSFFSKSFLLKIKFFKKSNFIFFKNIKNLDFKLTSNFSSKSDMYYNNVRNSILFKFNSSNKFNLNSEIIYYSKDYSIIYNHNSTYYNSLVDTFTNFKLHLFFNKFSYFFLKLSSRNTFLGLFKIYNKNFFNPSLNSSS